MPRRPGGAGSLTSQGPRNRHLGASLCDGGRGFRPVSNERRAFPFRRDLQCKADRSVALSIVALCLVLMLHPGLALDPRSILRGPPSPRNRASFDSGRGAPPSIAPRILPRARARTRPMSTDATMAAVAHD